MAEEYLIETHKLKYSQLPTCFGNKNKHLQPKRLDWIPPKKLTNGVLQNVSSLWKTVEIVYHTGMIYSFYKYEINIHL